MFRQRLLPLVATLALAIAALPGAGAAAPPPGQVSFSAPTLFPKFGPSVHDYVVRCNDGPVTVGGHASGGWEAAIGSHPFRSGDFSETVPLGSGRDFQVTAREVGRPGVLYRYHVRCLPNDFPTYTFKRYAPGSPKFFSADQFLGPTGTAPGHYAIIFDDHGVPIWWYAAPAQGTRVLPSGNVIWSVAERADPQNVWEIHRLNGSLVRTLTGALGRGANPHDLQLLGNGDHLVGSYVRQSHVDTSAYGGSSDADVVNTELQRVGPGGELVWEWKSQDHISLAETGRWWPWVIDNPTRESGSYDILHWNSIEPAGPAVIASFRHLDAVFKISTSTGNILWKLGGTRTPTSLTVKNDPRGYPLGAQHDARLLPDGTLTVFDNRSSLGGQQPRAVRYRIDEGKKTATLLQSITDPAVPVSNCCGSARRLANGDWLVGWGQNNPIAGYRPNGQRTFRLSFDSYFSYRAEPVPTGAVSARDLRQGMNAISSP